jgi:membrane protein
LKANLERASHSLREVLGFSWGLIKGTYLHTFFVDNVSIMAAAISFYTMLSIIPLLLIFVAISGYVLQSSEVAFQKVLNLLVKVIPASASDITAFLSNLVNKKAVFGIIGIGGLTWAASRIFSVVENSLNIVWRVDKGRPYLKSKLLSIVLVPLAVIFLVASVLLTAAYTIVSHQTIPLLNLSLQEIGYTTRILQIGIPLFLGILLFFLVYKAIPNRKVPTSAALAGALFAGISWEIAKFLFDLYIKHYTNLEKIYGSFGTLVVTLLWIFYSAFIVLVGAEFGATFEEVSRKYKFFEIFKRYRQIRR